MLRGSIALKPPGEFGPAAGATDLSCHGRVWNTALRVTLHACVCMTTASREGRRQFGRTQQVNGMARH
jgi:hypothetical protein